MEQWTPILIMLAITMAASIVLLLPTRVKYDSSLINFYWSGFWKFLSLIAFIAGGASALSLANFNVDPVSGFLLTGIMYVYIAFVVIGWFHICGFALTKSFKWFRKPEEYQP